MSAALAASPCIGLCRIAADGCCAGCRRSLEEIARWAAMSDAERGGVLARLRDRAVLGGFAPATGVNET